MDIVDKAIIFAVKAHSGALRKTSNTPYIFHPLEDAAIVATLTDDREIQAAAVLHDTVEDTDATIEEITELFGERVAELVADESEDKMRDRPAAETWRIRKEESIARMQASDDIAVKILWLGDKLSNIRSFHRSYLVLGDKLWEHFNQKDPMEHYWYYRTIADSMPEELQQTDPWNEYDFLITDTFKDYL
ncbi:MAG: HD domain-containing protein [Eubacterium sp.]|nr:HD domain-containing protein [Eubacterium sp.]